MRHVARTAKLLGPDSLAVKHFQALDFARLARIGDDAHHAGGLQRAFQHLGRGRARKARRARPQRNLRLASAHAGAHAHAEDAQIVAALQKAQRTAQGLRRLRDGVVYQRACQRLLHVRVAFLMEPQVKRAFRIPLRAERYLVAIPPLALGGQAWRHQRVRALPETARARKRGHHVGALGLKLRIVGKVLPRGGTQRRGLGPLRRHARRARLLDFADACAGERRLFLHHVDACHVSRRAAFDEHRFAACQVANRLSTVAHAFDRDDFGHAFTLNSFGLILPMLAYNSCTCPSSSVG